MAECGENSWEGKIGDSKMIQFRCGENQKRDSIRTSCGMTTLIVADESVDFLIVQRLREAGFQVSAIAEEFPGWPDAKVLVFAI